MSDFLAGIEQTPMRVDDDTVLDTPLLYPDAGAWMGLFPARMGAVHDLLPDPGWRPARLAPVSRWSVSSATTTASRRSARTSRSGSSSRSPRAAPTSRSRLLPAHR